MAARSVQKLLNEVAYYAKEGKRFLPWAAPAGLAAGWLAWPGLTPAFKEETLGIKQAPSPGSTPAAGAGGPVFRGNGKYKYVKSEIGERPSLAE